MPIVGNKYTPPTTSPGYWINYKGRHTSSCFEISICKWFQSRDTFYLHKNGGAGKADIGAQGSMSKVILDGNRALNGGPSFSFRNRLVRMLWCMTWLLLASWTPRILHPWRRFLLRLFGATMGTNSDVRGSARVWLPSNLTLGDYSVIGPNVTCHSQAQITLGYRALVSQGSYLCSGSHDVDSPDFQLIAAAIYIGDYAWVAADGFVGPGTKIHEGAVLGARGVAFGELDAWTIYVGNPSRKIRMRKNSIQIAHPARK